MLRHLFGLEEKARAIEKAVRSILRRRYRTADIAQPGTTLVGIAAMGDLIAAAAA